MSNEDGSVRYENLTQREYAAIHLRVTDPALPEWLNAMIERARRDSIAETLLATFIRVAERGTRFGAKHPENNETYARASYATADALLAQGRKP